MAYGDIGTVIDTYEFEPNVGKYCHIIHIDGDVYAIAYEHANAEARVKTVQIAPNGQITEPYIDDLLVHTSRGKHTRIQWVRGNIYVIASRDNFHAPIMSTVEILPNGQITDTIKDSWAWHTLSQSWHNWALRTAGILALAFQGEDADGWLYSIEIDLYGTITKTAIDTLEFDPSDARPGHIAEVHGGVFAISYLGSAAGGRIKTFSLDLLGELSDAVIDSLVFDATNGFDPWLTQVHEDIYAIPYQGPVNHGKICTVSITDAGEISDAVLDSMEFNATYCQKPSSVRCGGNFLAIAYTGPDLHGWLTTVEIDANGQITDTPLASFEFDPGNCFEPSIIRIAGNVYAIAYTGADDDGYLKTVSIESPLEERADHGPMIGIGP